MRTLIGLLLDGSICFGRSIIRMAIYPIWVCTIPPLGRKVKEKIVHVPHRA